MSVDEGSFDDRPVDPDVLESRIGDLPTAFRGVDSAAVERLVRRSAAEIRRLRREVERLDAAPRRDPAEIDEDMLTARLGEEAAMVLSAAREAAAQVRAKAEDNVARMVREAQDEIDQVRAKTERERALILARASDEAERTVSTAQRVQNEAVHRADAELSGARARAAEILQVTGEHRERVLGDLGELHHRLVAEIRALEKQRAQLVDDLRIAHGRVGRTLGDVDVTRVMPSPLSLPPPPGLPDGAAELLAPQTPRTAAPVGPPADPASRFAPPPVVDAAPGDDDEDGGAGDVGVETPGPPDSDQPSSAAATPGSDSFIGVDDDPESPVSSASLFDDDLTPGHDPPTADRRDQAPPDDVSASSYESGPAISAVGRESLDATESSEEEHTRVTGSLALDGSTRHAGDEGERVPAARFSRRRRRTRSDEDLPVGDVTRFRVDVGDDVEAVNVVDEPTGPIATVIELSRATPDEVDDEGDDAAVDVVETKNPPSELVDGSAPEQEPVVFDETEPESVAVEPESEPEPAAEAVAETEPELSEDVPSEPEPESGAVEPESEPEPESVAVEPESEPEPESVAVESEPEPESVAVEPEPEPEPEPETMIDLRGDAESTAADPPDDPVLGPEDLVASLAGGGPLDPRPGEYVVDLVDAADDRSANSRLPVSAPARPARAATVADDPSSDGGAADRAGALFAQLRASRAAQVDEARRVLAEPEPRIVVEDETPELAPESEPEDEPESEDEVGPADPLTLLFTGRDEAVEAHAGELVFQLKRLLADHQNELLDRLRRDGPGDLGTLIGDPADLLAAMARPHLAAAAVDGAGLIDTSAIDIDVDDLAAAFGAEVATPLTDRLHRAVSEAGAESGRRLRAVFREWRVERLPSLAESFAAAAVARGVFAAIEPGAAVVWRCHPDRGCAEGGDNELAGHLVRGDEFPTGHVEAPAYLGCRCVVVPADIAAVDPRS